MLDNQGMFLKFPTKIVHNSPHSSVVLGFSQTNTGRKGAVPSRVSFSYEFNVSRRDSNGKMSCVPCPCSRTEEEYFFIPLDNKSKKSQKTSKRKREGFILNKNPFYLTVYRQLTPAELHDLRSSAEQILAFRYYINESEITQHGDRITQLTLKVFSIKEIHIVIVHFLKQRKFYHVNQSFTPIHPCLAQVHSILGQTTRCIKKVIKPTVFEITRAYLRSEMCWFEPQSLTMNNLSVVEARKECLQHAASWFYRVFELHHSTHLLFFDGSQKMFDLKVFRSYLYPSFTLTRFHSETKWPTNLPPYTTNGNVPDGNQIHVSIIYHNDYSIEAPVFQLVEDWFKSTQDPDILFVWSAWFNHSIDELDVECKLGSMIGHIQKDTVHSNKVDYYYSGVKGRNSK